MSRHRIEGLYRVCAWFSVTLKQSSTTSRQDNKMLYQICGRLIPSGLLMAVACAFPAHSQMVSNGSFEADTLSQGNGTLALQIIPTGWSSISNGQNVDLLGGGFFGSTASDGDKFLDLIGNATGSFPSGVRQLLNLQAGVTYRLRFDYNGGAPLTVANPSLNWALGDLDSGSIDVGALNVFSGNGRTVTPWQSFTRDIAATASGDQWLSFKTLNGNSGGPYLDNVSLLAVAAAVPEPGTYALMLGGLGLIGLVAHRNVPRRASA